MPVITRWHNPNQTIRVYTLQDPWTWEELATTMADVRSEYDTLDHRAVGVIDAQYSSLIPRGALGKGREISKNRHPNVHSTILFVTNNNAFRSVGNLFNRMAGNYTNFNGEFVATWTKAEQRAHELLQEDAEV